MNPLLLILIKLLASSLLLFVFYLLLFKGKASYVSSRLFLLTIPLLSLVFSITSLEAENGFVRFSMSGLLENKAQVNNNESPNRPIYNAIELSVAEEQGFVDYQVTEAGEVVYANTPENNVYSIVIFIYLLVSIIFIATIFKQMRKIGKIRKGIMPSYIEGIPVYCSDEISNSFSVLKRIYVRNDMSEERLNFVIQHEYQHVQARHYIDLTVLEIMTVFLWFNPFMWLIRKELRATHEFEVDAKLINKGIKVREYMMAILEETTGNIPLLANGLQGSLIKKRFMNMKNGNRIRFKALRLALTAPFAVMLFIFFSCKPPQSEVAGETQYHMTQEDVRSGKRTLNGNALYEVRNANGEFELLWGEELTEKTQNMATFRIKGLPPTCIVNVDTAGNYIKDVTEEYSLNENNQEEGIDLARHNLTLGADNAWINPDGVALADWTRGWACRYNAKAITNKRKYIENIGYERGDIIRIVANERETRITFAATSYWDWCWRFTDKKTCLIDKTTGDRYMIRDIEGDEEVGRLSILEGTNGKWFEATVIFPPLKKGVAVVDYFSPFNNIDVPVAHNGTEKVVRDIEIKRFTGEIIR